MMEKDKAAASKNVERRTKPQRSQPAAPSRQVSPADPYSAAAPANGQRAGFEAAMKLFHERKLREARELFAIAAGGPESDVAQRARLHMAMCARRLDHETLNLRSAEDYYNYGVALINTRKLAEARAHLEKALEISPDAEHIHYALALAQALSGDTLNGYTNLKRAIELEPRNRTRARQDADFAPLANRPPFDALLHLEKSIWTVKSTWPEKKG